MGMFRSLLVWERERQTNDHVDARSLFVELREKRPGFRCQKLSLLFGSPVPSASPKTVTKRKAFSSLSQVSSLRLSNAHHPPTAFHLFVALLHIIPPLTPPQPMLSVPLLALATTLLLGPGASHSLVSASPFSPPPPPPSPPALFLRKTSSLNQRQATSDFDPTTAGFTPTDECADECGVFGAERGINITFLCSAGGFATVEACGECDPEMASKLGISENTNDTVVAVQAYQHYCVINALYTPEPSCAPRCSSMLTEIAQDCENPNSDGFCGPCSQNGITDFRICAACDANYIGAFSGSTVAEAVNNLITECPIANSSSSSSVMSSTATSARQSATSTSKAAAVQTNPPTTTPSGAEVRTRVGSLALMFGVVGAFGIALLF
ncbi:hypothetical protein BDY24DRAFT_389123, partial [Mrakia frigida]|uniref:uncharacterized protein n=1 Tax=Mrakia frigida TaxID=29902 RepID=UPI003FCC044F